jgi:hypothetical protein
MRLPVAAATGVVSSTEESHTAMHSKSLTPHAIIAVVLLFGFYVLGLALVIGLLAIPWAIWVFAERVVGSILLICVTSAAVIAWSMRPRFDHFHPTEPLLERSKHPRLFELVEDVARATNQAMPA